MRFIPCPRCGGCIETDGEIVFSSTSRADECTPVCAACGSDEALRLSVGGVVISTGEWPVPLSEAHRFHDRLMSRIPLPDWDA